MIYKKPQDALHMLDLVVEGGGVMSWVREVRLFLSALPDQFEIVPEGHVCVKWPEGLTRDRLEELAAYSALVFKNRPQTYLLPEAKERDEALRALAAIAPEKPKKRMVELWKRDADGKLDTWDYPLNPAWNMYGWRKVGGPFTIEE